MTLLNLLLALSIPLSILLHRSDCAAFPINSLHTTRQTGGYTLDLCTNSTECQGTRLCQNRDSFISRPCYARHNCFCYPVQFRTCATSDDCEPAEGCMQDLRDVFFCASRNAAVAIGYYLVPGASDPPPPPLPAITPAPRVCTGGRDYDVCQTFEDCFGHRFCWRPLQGPIFACVAPGACYCLSYSSSRNCTSSETCDCGELCIRNHKKDLICASKYEVLKARIAFVGRANNTAPTPSTTPLPSRSPSPSPSPDAVCIAVKSLKGVPLNELVYERHQLAHVLCDKEDSCATAGHMATFQGKAMMMSGYCEVVGCDERIMHVNSPKWGRKVRINSNTEGLMFTAFAARYNTGTEEKILSTLVRMGL